MNRRCFSGRDMVVTLPGASGSANPLLSRHLQVVGGQGDMLYEESRGAATKSAVINVPVLG